MTKDELISNLEECIKTGEDAILLYINHVENTLKFSGFSKDEQENAKDVFKELKDQAQANKLQLELLLDSIKQADKDVY